ncbi:MAG: ABC transporter ATP-binding protein [Planctomycetes bacterium]|nr:ABC transporter ATP-binding protein [Planctomycetota bacterium]
MIEFIDVHKTLGGKKVLDGLDLKIERGEAFAIIGRSGCGKSVTLKHMVGLMAPESGRVIVDGAEVTALEDSALEPVRKKFGFLFQNSALLNSLSVGENVGLPLREHKEMAEPDIRKRVAEVLELLGLRQLEEVMPADLSGGMRKRVALARAIIRKPEIILYDEPTTGLDPIMANVINNLIAEMHHKLKVTSIVVTHDMNSVFMVAERIALLYQGKIARMGTVDYFKNSDDKIVRQFVTGAPEGPMS